MTKDTLRIAPEGAKAPVQPAPPRVPQYVDVTPTWRAILPMLLAAHDSDSFKAAKEAETELRRMSDLADVYVKLAKHFPNEVRQMLDQIDQAEKRS